MKTYTAIVFTLFTLVLCSALHAQDTRLEITDTDPWLTDSGWIQGTYWHLDWRNSELYAWVHTGFWWPQPAWNAQWLRIHPEPGDSSSGRFSYRLDQNTSTVIAVFAFPKKFFSDTIPPARKFLPDEWFAYPHAFTERYPGRTFMHCFGQQWCKKEYPPPFTYAPPDNGGIFWSPENAFLDEAGDLHLRLTFDSVRRKYVGAELICTMPFSTGSIEATLITPVSHLKPNNVLSVFHWDNNPYQRNRHAFGKNAPVGHNVWNEFGIEFSLWGNPAARDNAQITIAPIDTDNRHAQRFQVPDVALTLEIVKELDRVTLSIYRDEKKTLLKRVMYDSLYSAAGGSFRINFWNLEADTLGNMQGEVVFRDIRVLGTKQTATVDSDWTITGHPNPFSERLHINTGVAHGNDLSISLYDMLGKCVYRGTIPQGALTWTIDTSALPLGMYFCILHNGSEMRMKNFLKRALP